MTLDTATPRRNPAGPGRARLRSAFVTALLGSLAATGLLGIAALVIGGFGQTQGRVLLSTLLVGLYSVLSLACLVVVGRRHGAVGAAGIAASSLALGAGLTLIWTVGDLAHDGDAIEAMVRSFWFCAVLGFALAHASLLLNAAAGARGATRTVAGATLAAVGVVAAMLCLLSVRTEVVEVGGFWRLLGVFAILDVVGTVFVPLTARFVGPRAGD